MTIEEKKHIIRTIFTDNEVSIEGNKNIYLLSRGGSLHSGFIHPLIECSILTQTRYIRFKTSRFNTWFYDLIPSNIDSKIGDLNQLYTKTAWDYLLPISQKLDRNRKLGDLLI